MQRFDKPTIHVKDDISTRLELLPPAKQGKVFTASGHVKISKDCSCGDLFVGEKLLAKN